MTLKVLFQICTEAKPKPNAFERHDLCRFATALDFMSDAFGIAVGLLRWLSGRCKLGRQVADDLRHFGSEPVFAKVDEF